MKGQKKFYLLLIILSLIALFSISCNNNNNKDKTGAEETKKDETGTKEINKDKTEKKEVKEERKLSYYAGDWYEKPEKNTTEKNILTINTDGSVILNISGDVKIPSSSITRVSDTNYTTSYNDSASNVNVKLTLIFSSDTEGKLMMESEGGPEKDLATVDITKK